MQEVSEQWKNAHKQTLLNESFVEVSLGVADPDALADASSRDNGAVYISDTPLVVSEVDKSVVPYCTLEQNLWLLDGGRKAIPESNYGDCGYISDVLCDDTCVFSGKMPVITIDFTKTFTNLIPGITITWGASHGEFADNFIMRAYDGEEIVAEKEVIGNRSTKSLVVVDIARYNRIVIQVKKWCLPNHRARVEEIFVGLDKVYGKADLFDYSHTQSVSPVSISLPKIEIKFSVDNVDGEYNPYNANGLAKYLMERQEVKARYGLKLDDGTVEWIKGGTFYLSEWYAKQNGMTADFTARDLLEFMSATYHDSITEITSRSLYDLAVSVLESANLPLNSDGTKKWVVDGSLEDIDTNAPLPEDSQANCLQLIANAGRCAIIQDRNGTLRIEPLKFDANDYKIDSFNSYSKPEITLSKPVKQVCVKVYTYTKGDDGIKSTTSEMYYPEQVANNIVGETITIDNPLITDVYEAYSLGEWLYTHLGHRMTLDASWRAGVRLDALDIITSENAYSIEQVRMTDVEYRYNGAFRATGKGKVIEDG